MNKNLREELDKTRNETEKQMDTIKNAIEENDEQWVVLEFLPNLNF